MLTGISNWAKTIVSWVTIVTMACGTMVTRRRIASIIACCLVCPFKIMFEVVRYFHNVLNKTRSMQSVGSWIIPIVYTIY
jgi:hypothetical protein